MQYRITKVYLVEADDRLEARRRLAAEGEAHLKIISVQELKGQPRECAHVRIDERPVSRYGEPYGTSAVHAMRRGHDGDSNPA